jgi:hypothetical protein
MPRPDFGEPLKHHNYYRFEIHDSGALKIWQEGRPETEVYYSPNAWRRVERLENGEFAVYYAER